MFPVEFARRQIETFTKEGGRVLDPFCGRGTVPFVSQVTGRVGLGVDVNPVAWLYAAVKLNPHPHKTGLLDRVEELLKLVQPSDCVAENAFQRLAWHHDVLGFLRVARRELAWRDNVLDRTLMGILLVHLHAKLGEGLSNQLRQSKSMAPDYAVRWWSARGMTPPPINLRDFFEGKLSWRYSKGVPEKRGSAEVLFGESQSQLKGRTNFIADLILTSPPYYGVTNYEYDNWIRLWMLGGPALPSFDFASRYGNQERYEDLLEDVFGASKKISSENVLIYVRTDARTFTRETTIQVLRRVWPQHQFFYRYDKATGPTQTALFGNPWNKAGEVDFLLMPPRRKKPAGFLRLSRDDSANIG